MTDGLFNGEDISTEPPSKAANLNSVERDGGVHGDVMAVSKVTSVILTPRDKKAEQGELFDELMSLFSENMRKTGSYPRKEHSNTIRKFAITMFTYSPKAYE